jgi:hypothetical protein
MPGPSDVFNRLSSLYFEVESSGGDVLTYPIRSPIDQCFAGEVLGPACSSSREGACLSPSPVHRKRTGARSFARMIVHLSCQGKEKPRTSGEPELAEVDCGGPRKNFQPCGKLFVIMHFCHCRCFQLGAAHCLTRFLGSTHLLRQDELALFFSQFAVDVPL